MAQSATDAAASSPTPIGDPGDEMLAHRDDLGVIRRTGARNPVSGSDPVDVRLDDDTGGAVSQLLHVVEPCLHLSIGRQQSLALNVVSDLAHEIGPRPGLADDRRLAVSTDVRSVPALINEHVLRTSTPPAGSNGSGRSSTRSSPVFWYCVTCSI